MKKLVAATLVCGLLVAACGDSKDSQNKAFCDSYAKGIEQAKGAGTDPSQMKQMVAKYKASLADLEKNAPAEIKPDVTEERKFLDMVAALYEKNNFQPSPDDMKKLQENAQAFQKMQQATQKISAYVQKNCPELAKQTGGGAGGGGAAPTTAKK